GAGRDRECAGDGRGAAVHRSRGRALGAPSRAVRAAPGDDRDGETTRRPDRRTAMIPRLAALIATLCLGCAAPSPPPPSTVRSVAVLAPSNRTGDGLLVAGASLLEKYAFHTDRVTVADVLGAELRSQLAHRGFAVVP